MNKREFRQLSRTRRAKISEYRRWNAAQEAAQIAEKVPGLVMSYASFGSELETQWLNAQLAKRGRLVLPHVEGDKIQPFLVEDLGLLKQNQWGIEEPDPLKCQAVSAQALSLVLVPALAFDSHGHRLGYGKGYYDRFLSSLEDKIQVWGLGFREQLIEDYLPTQAHDISIKHLFLV